jgi:hypothetical protein
MFDFEKLEVYQKAKVFHKKISEMVLRLNLSTSERDQLRRASGQLGDYFLVSVIQ